MIDKKAFAVPGERQALAALIARLPKSMKNIPTNVIQAGHAFGDLKTGNADGIVPAAKALSEDAVEVAKDVKTKLTPFQQYIRGLFERMKTKGGPTP